MIDVKWLEAANCVIKRMREQRDTARTASAAWKASAKRHMHNYKVLKFYWQEEKSRAEAAEQRVAELEEAAIPVLEELIRISEGYFDTERYQIRIHAIAKLRRTLFDKQIQVV